MPARIVQVTHVLRGRGEKIDALAVQAVVYGGSVGSLAALASFAATLA
ncbi:MAG: hypothetical protein JNM92_08970 [Zoogloea sp.]|nr:hypothetical protein [Zoogloea sp.]